MQYRCGVCEIFYIAQSVKASTYCLPDVSCKKKSSSVCLGCKEINSTLCSTNHLCNCGSWFLCIFNKMVCPRCGWRYKCQVLSCKYCKHVWLFIVFSSTMVCEGSNNSVAEPSTIFLPLSIINTRVATCSISFKR